MVTLVFQFPGRRYHATPPGHHVNEGLVEWPPSPWRLLRALVATGYTKLGWTVVPEVARSLLDKLASALPQYSLPPAAAGHTRHYMPVGRLDNGREKTTLVFDTWAEVGSGDLGVAWDTDLQPDEQTLLEALAAQMSYLGRAESWVVGRVVDGDSWGRERASLVFSCENQPRPGPGWEQITLLAAEVPETYQAWRAERLAQRDATPAEDAPKTKPRKVSKKGTKKATAAKDSSAEYPADLVACLEVDSTWIEAHGWSQPPGSRRVLYWRRRDALEVGAPSLRIEALHARPVDAMLLALATPSGNKHALPTLARTLPQSELLHRALVSHVARIAPDRHGAVTGKDDDGVPLVGHRHLHLMPLDLDGDGHLDHVLVWAPMGLDGAAQHAVRAIRQTYTKGGVGELRVALAGAGDLAELRALPGELGDTLRRTLGPASGARIWESETPFVAPRHLKARGRASLDGQIAGELESRRMPTPAVVTAFDVQTETARKLRHFVRVRRTGPTPPTDFGLALRLEFETPVPGPICLGYGSHFGLGRFVAIA